MERDMILGAKNNPVKRMTVTLRWFSHATFQIKTENEVIYVDLYRRKKHEENVPEITEPASFILVTHAHGDHCDPKAISKVRKADTVVIAPEDCRKKIGGDVTSLKTGQEITIRDVQIKAVHAYNVKRFRSPGNPYHPEGYGVGYLVSIEGMNIYHAGDTDVIPEMSDLGHVDVALLPTGDTYTMDNQEGAEAVAAVKPRYAIPMHTWDKSTDEFRDAAESRTDTRVVQLAEGEEFTVD
jgi:L-ascorbate metabolism protein UlaG (beta-lactamase superfamily)